MVHLLRNIRERSFQNIVCEFSSKSDLGDRQHTNCCDGNDGGISVAAQNSIYVSYATDQILTDNNDVLNISDTTEARSVDGWLGDDEITTGSGNDEIFGGAGNDKLNGQR